MKAPLSQTLFLTEDGSTVAVTIDTAVTIPPLIIVNPLAPTIAFDAPTASIGEGNSGSKNLTSVLALNRDGLAGDRVVNLTYGGTAQRGTDYTAPDAITVAAGSSAANLDLVVLGENVVENDELVVITARLAGYSSVTASKTITIVNDDVAPFTEQPTISNDGTPSVGETFAFTFGAHPNGLGTKRLLRNGVDFADAAIGSYTAVDADAGKTLTLVVRDASGAAMASVSINVAAAAAADLPAFTLSNPDNFVSGTNPPRFRVSIPGPPESNFDKSLHEMIVEWDNASSGTFSVATARSARVRDLMAFADKEDATIDNLTKQPEGQPYRVRVRPIRKADGAEGPNSNFFVDTMAAAQIAPTSFDPALAGAGTPNDAIRLSNNNRTAALGYALSDQAAWSPLARGIGAKVSFTFAGTTSTYGFLFGTTRVGSQRKLAMVPGYTEVNGAQVATFDFNAADTVTFELVANATTPANIDILVSKNGGPTTRLVLNSSSPLYFAGYLSGESGRTVTISDFSHWGTV